MVGAKLRLVLRKFSSELPASGDNRGNPDSLSPRRECSALPVEGTLLPQSWHTVPLPQVRRHSSCLAAGFVEVLLPNFLSLRSLRWSAPPGVFRKHLVAHSCEWLLGLALQCPWADMLC